MDPTAGDHDWELPIAFVLDKSVAGSGSPQVKRFVLIFPK